MAKNEVQAPRANFPRGWQWPPTDEMRQDGRACLAGLTARGVRWKHAPYMHSVATPIMVPDLRFGAIRLESKFRKPPFIMDCHLAVALHDASAALAALGVKTLRFSSVHYYRRVRIGGKVKNSLSRHALGLAVDIYEIDLHNGQRVVVEKGFWDPRGLPLELHRAFFESGLFRLLSPLNDASHHDHFHLEAQIGAFRTQLSEL